MACLIGGCGIFILSVWLVPVFHFGKLAAMRKERVYISFGFSEVAMEVARYIGGMGEGGLDPQVGMVRIIGKMIKCLQVGMVF